MPEEIVHLLLQVFGGSGREHHHIGRRLVGCSLDRRRLFKDQMRVGAAEPERTDGRSPCLIAFDCPFLQPGIDIERTRLEIDAGTAFLEMQGWRDLPVLQRQQKFQDTRDTRGRGRMTDIRSEEHTSELQSRLHLVCRLLLEKKKNKSINHTHGGMYCKAGPCRLYGLTDTNPRCRELA